MEKLGFVSIRFLESLLEVCRKFNVDIYELEKASDVPLQERNEDATINSDEYCTLLATAADLCNDPDIGLQIGETIKPGHFGVLGYACMTAKNLGEALTRALNYQTLVADICLYSLAFDNDNVILTIDFPYSTEPNKHLESENLASSISFAKWICGDNTPPTKILLQQDPPQNIDLYASAFDCELIFQADKTQVIFSKSLLNITLPQADHAMHAMMEKRAEELLLKANESQSLSNRVMFILSEILQDGEPSLEKLAKAMELNVRTLQRQLKTENISYQNLLEQVRKNLALVYINQPELSLIDIAFLLGFSEQSSFQRAFKRWTGETPGKYKKSRQMV